MTGYELLAPAGSMEALIPMAEGGADAIFVGVKGFSSREKKSDMTIEEIGKAVEICHSRNVKIFAALNVAVSEREIENVKDMIFRLDSMKVDAVILADTGLIRFFSDKLRHSVIHASTLLGVYNIESVRYLKSIGVKRIIFYAGLYFDEMAAICNAVPDMEYELVAEGGTCFNDIRQCLLPHTYQGSEHCLACRFQYQFRSENKNKPAKPLHEYANMVAEVLPVYMGIGIHSFKIEGRTSPWQERLEVVKRVRRCIDEYAGKVKPKAYLHYFSRANREMF